MHVWCSLCWRHLVDGVTEHRGRILLPDQRGALSKSYTHPARSPVAAPVAFLLLLSPFPLSPVSQPLSTSALSRPTSASFPTTSVENERGGAGKSPPPTFVGPEWPPPLPFPLLHALLHASASRLCRAPPFRTRLGRAPALTSTTGPGPKGQPPPPTSPPPHPPTYTHIFVPYYWLSGATRSRFPIILFRRPPLTCTEPHWCRPTSCVCFF